MSLPCRLAECVKVDPAEFVFSLTQQDPVLRPRYFRSLLRPLLLAYAEPRGVVGVRFEELLLEVAKYADPTVPPTVQTCAAALGRWKRSAIARWQRVGASARAASVAVRLFSPLQVPSREQVPVAEARWRELLAAWSPTWSLQPHLLEALLEDIEPLDTPASQPAALRFLSARAEERQPPAAAPPAAPPAPPAPQDVEAIVRLFRKALILGHPSLAAAREARDLTAAQLPELREALPEEVWLRMTLVLADLAASASTAEHLATGADGLLEHAALMRSKNIGVVDWVLEKWRKVCAEAMAKWRPHDPKGSFKGVPALQFLYYGHAHAASPEGGQEQVRRAPSLPEALLPELLLSLGARMKDPGHEDKQVQRLVAEVRALQLHRQVLIEEWMRMDESLRTGEAAVLAAFDRLAEEQPDYAQAYARLLEHPKACGLADLNVYHALATESTLGLLSRLMVFFEELPPFAYPGYDGDVHKTLWVDFAAWLRRPEGVTSLLPPEAARLRVKEKCARCRGPASRHGTFERARDEGQTWTLVCDSSECGHVARS